MDSPPRAPSQSAILTAAARAHYRTEKPPWIFDDTLAAALAGEAGASMLRRLESRLSPEELMGFCRWVCVRARFVEDAVERALAGGVEQYVILGAGLDSFAYRRADLMDRLRVFEVDSPASQRWKRERLEDVSIQPPPNLVFAAVDFERQPLLEGLAASGFDVASRAVFSWIGVTMYLTMDAIRSTLREVASCARETRIVLTYNQPLDGLDGFSRAVTGAIAAALGEGGEPFLSLFTPTEAQALLEREGFRRLSDFGAAEAGRDYFRGRQEVRIAGAQRILIAEVGRD